MNFLHQDVQILLVTEANITGHISVSHVTLLPTSTNASHLTLPLLRMTYGT